MTQTGETDAVDTDGTGTNTGPTTVAPTTVDTTTEGGECSVDSDCPPDYYCAGSHCIPYNDYCETGGCCGECCYDAGDGCGYYQCYSDADCGGGEYCSYGGCYEDPTASQCGNGIPGSWTPIPVPADAGQGALSLSFMDADGDAARDLVVVRSADASVLHADGTSMALPVPGGAALDGAVTGDFDGDGAEDVVLADGSSGGLLLVHGDGMGGFAAAGSSSTGATIHPVAADFDGDGDLDVAASDGTGVWVAWNDGMGTFGTTLQLEPLQDAGVSGLAAVQPSAGAPDLAFDTAGVVWLWAGSPGQPVADQLWTGTTSDRLLAAADLDDDMNDELVSLEALESGDTLVRVLQVQLDANQGFTWPTVMPGASADLGLGDIDGDGRIDLVLAQPGGVYVYLGGQPNGAPFDCWVQLPPDHGATVLALGDMDGNGSLDVAYSDGTSLTVLGRGGG